MKNPLRTIPIFSFLVGFILVALLSCNKSMAPSKEDPTLLAFVVNNGGPPSSPEQTLCLVNVNLINSCIGGSHRGDGLSGAVCSANVSQEEQALGALLATPAASTCIAETINETNCNLSINNVPSVGDAFAEGGPFAGLVECIATAIAEEQALSQEEATPSN